MSKISINIPYPSFIEHLFVWFVLRYRKKRYGFAFRKIRLVGGKYAIVDVEDYQNLSKYNWQLSVTDSQKYYAICLDNRLIKHMHRVIMNAEKGQIVDHIDRNGLNNTKRNLRFATLSQNSCNRVRPAGGSSKYRGVNHCKDKKDKEWRANICLEGKKIHLGYFEDEETAGRAYDEAAKELHGEFACLNFPENSHEGTKTLIN
ncbi:MAG: HNH endonuclease [Sedimentisphaerales bacterium]|nr:HNH endonuclease [Sedimentisphaerales bacterium]